MIKVIDPSYSDEKGMTIIVNRLNISLFQAIYFDVYAVSDFIRLPTFIIL